MNKQQELESINKQIDELLNKQALLTKEIEKEKKEAELAKLKERDDALEAIKQQIKLFNETYDEHICLAVSKGNLSNDCWDKLFVGTPFEGAFRR
jgi:predicted Holliday junction resolvase-like endonuclease